MSDYTFDEYQRAAAKTAVFPGDFAIEYLVCGLAAEAGEVAGGYAKYLQGGDCGRTGHKKAARAMLPELGGCLWFVANLASEYGYSLEDVAKANIAKLADRQARGKIKGSGDER